MKPRFRTREAMLLYLVVLACLSVLFLVGLELGRGRVGSGSVAQASRNSESPTRSDAPQDDSVAVFQNLTPEASTPSSLPESAQGTVSPDPTKPVPSDSSTKIEGAAKAPSGTTPSSSAAPSPNPRYTIQVAAHTNEEDARQTLLRLEAKGFAARIQPPTPALGDRFYRVWVGEFDTPEQARAEEARVKAAGFLTYVRKTE